jgi:hypothetical protein
VNVLLVAATGRYGLTHQGRTIKVNGVNWSNNSAIDLDMETCAEAIN